ncbi:transposase [Scytonema sp. HK-05]|uniref:RNA-guided endonuclease InsQ/TnpB family protein n=1 Tax=Scytonema sp. HK-05 TaxID=1137095 RepID=UPI000936A130|nr:RNA-guided endonuclease TnpB family protein [Scytonema sp. HK-05]OKH55907.1 transposase [Scytonema sp. HK-05]BAY49548.1 transposase [Scytonema sp. HK-05]
MFNLTYEFKLKPTQNQVEIFEEWLETHRRVYNHALAERKDWYKSRSCQVNACSLVSEYIIRADAPRPTFASQCKSLTAARKENEYLKRVNAQSLQQTLRRLEKAFVSMWEQNHGFPRFKKRDRMRSFSFPQLGQNPLSNGYVKLPVIGVVKVRQSRDIPDGGVIKQARVVKRVSGWYVMLTVQWDLSVPSPLPHGEAVGIDVGLTSFVATSNGLLVKRPRFFVDALRKLKLLQQRVSRKRIGSNNWKKAHKKVASLHEYVANCRKDWHRKLSHQICNNAGMVFVEDLNLVGLSRGMLGKHCLDAGFGQFFNILEQTCFKRDVYFQKVDSRKTSQICPNCGTETGKKELSQRIHVCSNCGYTTDRDIAAAQVVRERGLAAVGHTVKMLAEGKFIGVPVTQESPAL